MSALVGHIRAELPRSLLTEEHGSALGGYRLARRRLSTWHSPAKEPLVGNTDVHAWGVEGLIWQRHAARH